MYRVIGEPIILASGSPRRSEMLSSCGIAFEKRVSDCDESILAGENPEEMVRRLSLLKSETVSKDFMHRWVLGADTTVVVDGRILGKPNDAHEAFEMLSLIQGRAHEVWGAFSLVHQGLGVSYTESHRSEVRLIPLEPQQIRAYISTNEPMDKAGSYAIQGLGASIVAEVRGSYTNVVGLNLSALVQALLSLSVIERIE